MPHPSPEAGCPIFATALSSLRWASFAKQTTAPAYPPDRPKCCQPPNCSKIQQLNSHQHLHQQRKVPISYVPLDKIELEDKAQQVRPPAGPLHLTSREPKALPFRPEQSPGNPRNSSWMNILDATDLESIFWKKVSIVSQFESITSIQNPLVGEGVP
jgi:hypothetical protein